MKLFVRTFSFAAVAPALLSLGSLAFTACGDDAAGTPPGATAGAAGQGGSDGLPVGGGAGTAGSGGAAGAAVTPEKGLAPLVASCAATTTGAPAFTDATDKWEMGKGGLALTGGRAMVADLDGDGFPDLIIHRVTSNTRTNIADGAPVAPAQWPYRVLLNRPSEDGSHRRFVDATLASGYGIVDGTPDVLRSAQLAVAADVDNDGDLDLFQGTNTDPANAKTDPGDKSRILLNDGQGVFTPAASSDVSPQPKERWPTTGLTFADVDRDGRVDAFAGFFYQPGQPYGYQAQLYKGTGDGTFTYGTDAAGLDTFDGDVETGENNRPAYGITSCDLDDDGSPELMVSAYGRQWNLLYQNDGKGAFKEIGQASGFAGDTLVDFSDNQNFACFCTVDRETKPLCKDVKKPLVSCGSSAEGLWGDGSDDQPWRNNGNTFTTVCADLDGDGKSDLYNVEIAHWWAGKSSDKSSLLRNTSKAGAIGFERMDNEAIGTVIPHVGTDWNEGGIHGGAGDFDNDGRQDLLVAMSDYPDQYAYFFSRGANGKFSDKGKEWGIVHPCAVGPAIADFDRDGDLDVILAASTARDCAKLWPDGPVLRFYENDASTKGGFLAVRLRGNGTDTNRAAVGAKITIKTGDQIQVREVSGGFGHMGLQPDLVSFFGVGACTVIDSVTVRWPNQAAAVEEWKNVEPGAMITLTQGVAAIERFAP